MNAETWSFHFSINAHNSRVNALMRIYFKKVGQEFNFFGTSDEYEYLVSCSDDGEVKFWSIEEKHQLSNTI
jgi:hypothetical protein